jgi:hypothetical protein
LSFTKSFFLAVCNGWESEAIEKGNLFEADMAARLLVVMI